MNIVQYVTENKSTFEQMPFNEVDSLVLCELSYLHYTRAVAGAPAKTLKQLAENVESLIKDTLLPKSNAKLIKAIAASPRFSDVKVGYFRERNSVKREIRFAAVTFQIKPDLHYLAYRGTDITLLGWKEDFNMAIVKVIPSQKLAIDYMEFVASQTEGELILGGHSKGGNLVIYSGVFGSEKTKKRVSAIYDHDGPGFKNDIFEDPRYVEMIPRIHKTVPHDSIIGMLLTTMQHYDVVESNSVSVMQHNPFSWEVKDFQFKKLPETAHTSVATDEALTNWIASLDKPTTKKLVNAIFTVLRGGGVETVPELLKNPLKKLIKMQQAFKSLDEESKQLLLGNGKELIALWFASMRHVRSTK